MVETHADQDAAPHPGGPVLSGRRERLHLLLADATEMLLTTRSLPAALEQLCQRAAGVLGDGISITLQNHDATGYTATAAAHVDPAVSDLLRQVVAVYPGEIGTSAEARRRGEALVIDELDPSTVHPARYPLLRAAGVRRVISVPLSGIRRSGNLAVYATRPDTLLDETIYQIATILGERISTALAQHELLAAAEQHAADLQALIRSAQVVAQQRDLSTTLAAIADEIERIIPSDLVGIWRVDRDAGVLEPQIFRRRGRPITLDGTRLAIGQGLISTVLETRQPVYYPESHRDPRAVHHADWRPLIAVHGESTMVGPLTAGDEVVGVIALIRLGVDRFSPQDFTLFQLFADQVAAALRQTVALEAERERRRWAETLAQTTAAIAHAQAPAELAPLVATAAAALAGCGRAWVVLWDPEHASVVATADFPAAGAAMSPPPPPAGRPEATRPSEPHWLDDLSVLPAWLAAALGARGMARGIAAPLIAGDTWYGEIYAWQTRDPARRAVQPEQLDALRTLANQAAAALARLLANRSLTHQLQVNTALRRAAEIALEAESEPAAVDQFLALVVEATGARAASAWLLDADEQRLVRRGSRGDPGTTDPDPAIALSASSPLTRAWHTGASVVLRRGAPLVVAPIQGPDGALGVIRLDYAADDGPDDTSVALIEALARQLGLALATLRLRQRWRRLYRSSVEALAAMVDARDPYTHAHSRNVAHYSRLIATRLRLPASQVEQIELAGLLHDIGKIGIADRILTKEGPLDAAERMVMMTHPTRGAEILASHADLVPVVPLVRHHHERYDGRGYPDGLAGDAIPLGAAIVAAADAFDTMVNDRGYAKRRSVEDALRELEAEAGKHFHPAVVTALVEIVREDPGVVRVPKDDQVSAGRRQSGRLPVGEIAQVRILSGIAHELGALTDLATFIARARAIVASELGYPDVQILLRDPASGTLTATGQDDAGDLALCGHIAALAVASRTLVNIGDVTHLPAAPASTRGIRSALAVPLVAEEEVQGALCAAQHRPHAFDALDEELLTSAANQLAAAIRVAQLHDQVKWAAHHDGLTEALNRRAFYQELTQAIARQARTGAPASLILCDVEGLKQINDRLGHVMGDRVLQAVVERLRALVRPGDLVARYGGDEFAVITFGTSREQAEQLGERIRASLTAEPILPQRGVVMVTVGVAQIGEEGTTPAELIARADARLYAARARRA
ncbi:MAG: GAF domain-containing protein [Sphaerobacter sp.]|nr:GAF domain-containing protein [Sphaerobacter sp.]